MCGGMRTPGRNSEKNAAGERPFAIEEALADIDKECAASENIKYLTDFIKKSERGIAR